MRLKEILEARKRASADAYLQVQPQAEQTAPAPVYQFVICQELDAYYALFEGCEDF